MKYHLANMANRSRLLVLKGDYRPPPKFVVPLVSSLHPATTVLSKVVKSSFSRASSGDPVLDVLLPSSSLFVSYTRLPNLQLLLCPNDQNKLATAGPPNPIKGYTYTECNCLVCQASLFSPWVSPPSMPGYCVKIPETTTCQSTCKSATGRASTLVQSKRAMAGRWSNHKSQFKNNHNFCAMTSHLLAFHKGEDPQKFVQIQILHSAPDLETAKKLEKEWTMKQFCFLPSGLNLRDEYQDLL